jgi:hypothetical protein
LNLRLPLESMAAECQRGASTGPTHTHDCDRQYSNATTIMAAGIDVPDAGGRHRRPPIELLDD